MTDNVKNKKLFTEFAPVNTAEWEAVIQKDLKGADYEKKLVWRPAEGFKVQPYYRAENLKDKEYLDSPPGTFPYTRGNNSASNDWEIRQDLLVDDIGKANQKSRFILDRGITSLGFITSPDKGKTIIQSQNDFSLLLKDIFFECIGLYFECGNNAPDLLNKLIVETEKSKIDANRVIGAIDFDPIGFLTSTGNWNESEEADINELKNLIKFSAEKLPNYRVLGISGYKFNGAGLSIVQELAYSLSMANEYLNQLINKGLSIDDIAPRIQFNFGVGSNYFMEIAKLRAARFLWAKITGAYTPKNPKSQQAFIHSKTSEWNQTLYDPYMNVLRATTEAMSAVIGGTNSLKVHAFDHASKTASKFSGRISRNIQIILKEETYLDKVVDPAAGSYYIENLTDSIIHETWKVLLYIEEQGGYLEALKKGIIQAEVEKASNLRESKLATRQEILLGTNQFPDFNENILAEIDEEVVFKTQDRTETTVLPLQQYRGSFGFEKLRLATEKHTGGRPKVYMLPIGNTAMRKVRASFACNFFGCAGYEVIDNIGFQTVEEGINAALKVKADIIVICSSDDEYEEYASKAFSILNHKAILVVAGAPACMEELKARGVTNFVHVRSNVLATLQEYHKKLGIK